MRETTKIKKIVVIFIVSIVLLSAFPTLYVTGVIIPNPTELSFEDQNLYNAIVNKIKSDKVPYNDNTQNLTIEVSKDYVESVVELNLEGTSDEKITNLKGLEKFTSLTKLNLAGNSVVDMSCIANTQITDLNMTGNPVNNNILENIQSLKSLKVLDMTSTKMNGDQLEYLKTLVNLNTLKLSNNNISKLEPIAVLNNITILDISKNTSFTEFSQIASHTELKELNISGTGISTLEGIQAISGLKKLYAADNVRITETTGISPVYHTYRIANKEYPYLAQIETLNLSNLGIEGNKPSINFTNFAKLATLKELHLASNEITNLSNVAKLENLEYLDLEDNKIQSATLGNLVQYQKIDGVNVLMRENTLKASRIDLSGNEIIDISIFSIYPVDDIIYLDLSENHIYDINPLTRYSFSEGLYLERQNITFGIYDKNVDVNQYIILPSIFTKSKIKGSIVYSENAEFKYSGVTLNTEYTNPSEYNVIIDSAKTKEDQMSITLIGGKANGTVLNLQIGTTKNAHVSKLIDSLLFVDENLDRAIYRDLVTRYGKQIVYITRVPRIININQDVIAKVADYNLQHIDTDENTKIKDLTGLENFYNLTKLYLQDNNISTIQQLAVCTKLQILNLANNPNINDNNSAIENMILLTDLDLSNTGMTNINSINNLTNNLLNSKKAIKLAILNISDNGLTNIDGLEKITTLQKLYIANEKLTDNNIKVLEALNNLETLNMNGNQIENIDVLTNLTKIKYLYISDNKIQSLNPINGMTFYELEFSRNRIKDIYPLSEHHSINNLKMDNNYIEDVSILSNISITEEQILSVTGQKIVRALEKGTTGIIEIDLPQIFIAAQENGNKLYTNSELIQTKCQLDDTKTKVIVNVEELENDIAQVEIYGGKASGTILSIASPLEATVTYLPSNETITKESVTVTISFNRNEVTILNNDGKNSYTFLDNGEFTFDYMDKYGFEGTTTITITNIDKKAPEITGVKNNEKYKEKVIPVIEDSNLSSVILTKDGKVIENYKNGNAIEEAGKYILTATDVVKNTTTIEFEIEKLSDIITSTYFNVIEEEKIIRNIKPNTGILEFKSKIQNEMPYEILDNNGKIISNESDKLIATGCQVKMENAKIYELIVKGDLNGDGEMNDVDLLRMARYKAGLDKNLKGRYLDAANIYEDSNLADDIDLLKMVRILIGLDSL